MKTDGSSNCSCHHCIERKGKMAFTGAINVPLNFMKMVLCDKCGNKRCPRASHHNNACTNSNEPGQPGSIFV